MNAYCVLYNPLAATGRGESRAHSLDKFLGGEITYQSLLDIDDKRAFIESLPADVTPVLTGGDGTIFHFINALEGRIPQRDILYYPAGSGNDFLNDLGRTGDSGPFLLNPYITDLPRIHFGDHSYVFLNGVGYGIDGYVCEEAARVRKKNGKPINYTAAAIKGLLFAYKPTKATVTIDGKTSTYDHVWLTPTMNGRYFGGGMMCAPTQDRLNPLHKVTLMVMRHPVRLWVLCVFPSIFKGKHLRFKKVVSVFSGHRIHVRFDRPTALQIDGEVFTGVSEYTVTTCPSAT